MAESEKGREPLGMREEKNQMRVQGTVRDFGVTSPTFGWITPDSGERPLFVHHGDIIGMAGYKELYAGDRVEYAVEQSARGLRAVRVKVIEAGEDAA